MGQIYYPSPAINNVVPVAVSFAAPTVVPSVTGSTTWIYIVVAKFLSAVMINSLVGNTSTGTVTLSSTDFNTLLWAAVPGATSYDIYRTFPVYAAGATGYIGTTTALTFLDIGQAVIGPSQGDTSSTNTAFPNMGGYSEFPGLQIGTDFNTFPMVEALSGSNWVQLGPSLDPNQNYAQYVWNSKNTGGILALTYAPPSSTFAGGAALAGTSYNAVAGGQAIGVQGIGLDIATSGTTGVSIGGAFSGAAVGTNTVSEIIGVSAEFDVENTALVTAGYGLKVITPVIVAPALFQNVTTYTGVFVDDPWGLSPAGTRPANVYGLRIAAYTTYAAAANVWGVYVDNAASFFGAPITIRDSATAGGVIAHATRVVTVSAAHLNSLHTVPIQVLPAAPANHLYVINNVMSHYRFNTTGFTLNAATYFLFGYTAAPSTYPAFFGAALTGFCDATPTTDTFGPSDGGPYGTAVIPTASAVGAPIYVSNDAANMSGGDGTVTFTIDYSIIDTTQLGTAV